MSKYLSDLHIDAGKLPLSLVIIKGQRRKYNFFIWFYLGAAPIFLVQLQPLIVWFSAKLEALDSQ